MENPLAILLVALLASCSSSAASSPSSAATDASSSVRAQTDVCAAAENKGCLSSTLTKNVCQADLATTNASFVAATQRCVDALVQCKDANDLLECLETAAVEITPGYPNVPEITACKDKDLSCPGFNENDTYCEKIVRLDAAGKKRATECVATADCAAFRSCMRQVGYHN